MKFPLSFTFKIAALAPQFSVQDVTGNEIAYVRQKLFKLRENISVFQDSSQQNLITEIQADRIIDFSAAYHLVDSEGVTYGQVKRRGTQSIWKTRYDVSDLSQDSYTIQRQPLGQSFGLGGGRTSAGGHADGLHAQSALRRYQCQRRGLLHPF